MPLPVSDDSPPPDWRAIAGALEHTRSEWRKLGPLEHTVPHKARDALVKRLEEAQARLEGPLAEARRVAQRARERLVQRARELAAQATAGQAARDSVDPVRALQAEWQQQAKALPLARPVETALWADFKAAVDAVYGAREAAFGARDAQFKAGAAERVALIDRLEGLDADTPAAKLKRALADAEAQWQRAAPPPRQEAAALESRWRAVLTRWREHLAGESQRTWQALCDALAARLAECDAADDGPAPATARAELLAREPGAAALPPAWARAVAQRLAAATATPPAAIDDQLLRLEIATGLASPAAQEAERRALKLRALKSTLEGRQSGTDPGPAAMLATLLAFGPMAPAQRTRVAAIVAGLRSGEPLRPD